MVSSTILTLLVIPVFYAIVKGWQLPRTAARRGRGTAASTEPCRVNQESVMMDQMGGMMM